MNGDPDTAADITQDVFLKLLENIQSVRKIGKFQNYLLTIAVNTCNNYTKKAKPLYMDLETLEDIEDTDNAFEKIELNELKAQIQYAINTLPDYQKEVIILRFYYDCNGVQREHNKKLNNGLPILHKVPPKRDYGRYFCIMAEKGGTSHGGLTEKLSLFFHAKKQEVNAYGR